ncbi:MAG: di-trans,poly-cis-decaprenylcistransferase [Gammaproteobacteria bacterium]|nr:di-trans,poly-cis-decaprenylcistransferase [Gammaproteobacteria bacterium]MCH9744041.1 di-trans,poly-cis-decaprenylcistransferase [Gammaproteobacteria bacterium]
MTNTTQTPQHIAIVMDGNGRWAKRRGLPRIMGHREGAKSVRRVVECCVKKKIKVLTLFALSVENKHSRPAREVKFLLSFFLESLQKNTTELHQNKVRVRVIGNLAELDQKLLRQIKSSEQLTAQNDGLELVIAINYSGRWDLANAAKHMAHDVQSGLIAASEIDESMLGHYVQLSNLPEPDLLIRTGGEQRISNFLLWQLAYTEIFFTETYWPDFDEAAFDRAIDSYARRERRFGKTGEQLQEELCA